MSPTLRRLCPGCKTRTITQGRRCEPCERAYAVQRGTTTARGLGYQYQQNRARVLAVSDICHICGNPGADSADHLTPRSRDGSSDISNLKPAHRRCNAKRGDRFAGGTVS